MKLRISKQWRNKPSITNLWSEFTGKFQWSEFWLVLFESMSGSWGLKRMRDPYNLKLVVDGVQKAGEH